jgi:inhibitor of KinA sporulation pathway (predicted exonuclease)
VATGMDQEIGMDMACRRLGTSMEGTHHRGVDDAWNVAGLLCALLTPVRGAVAT